jgi:hypothetical protein
MYRSAVTKGGLVTVGRNEGCGSRRLVSFYARGNRVFSYFGLGFSWGFPRGENT